MNDLIEALKIFAKYGNPHNPTHCLHDTLLVCIDPEDVSEEDTKRLAELDFSSSTEHDGCFYSFRFGAA